MSRWLWILLTVQAIVTITDAGYSEPDVQRIVRGIITPEFQTFPMTDMQRRVPRQYGVLMVLPAGHFVALDHGPNGPQIINNDHLDLHLGFNYAVAKPAQISRKKKIHTETQLLQYLPTLINNYRAAANGLYPPAVLLYTRATPCSDCTQAIIQARQSTFRERMGQFIVAYSANMLMNGMNNCENRRSLWRNEIEVYCVREVPFNSYSQGQCTETC